MTINDDLLHILVTVIVTLAASSGFWAYIMSKDKMKNASTQLLIGLGHDRIMYLGEKYIAKGSITQDEYENLYTYLYIPYTDLKGNGSAKRIMDSVYRLPVKPSSGSSYSVQSTEERRDNR